MRSHQTLRSFFFILVCIVAAMGPAQRVAADTLYGATGGFRVDGHLLILDQDSGAVLTDVGALHDAAGNKYGVTGLAFDPVTGNLFGSTSNNSPTARSHLVLINPGNAQVTDIGTFGFINSTMSDITFDPISGTLYGWRSGDKIHGLYTINPATGDVTLVGGTTEVFGGGGLAANSDGTLFNTPDGSPDCLVCQGSHLTTIDKATGSPITELLLSGGPTPRVINAMDFNSAGLLFGVQTTQRIIIGDLVIEPTTHLVIIDTTTAAITDLGQSANNLDAIAFLRSTAPEQVPEPTSMLLLGLGLAGAFFWVKRPQLSKVLVVTARKRQRR